MFKLDFGDDIKFIRKNNKHVVFLKFINVGMIRFSFNMISKEEPDHYRVILENCTLEVCQRK